MRIRRWAPLTVAMMLLVSMPSIWAAQQIVQIPPGDTGHCSTHLIDVGVTDATCAPDLLEGVPVCQDHDVTKWHALVKRDADDVILCTYGHEHHDDPNSVNDIFGPPGAWWASASQPAQEISYPWQTSGSAGTENMAKHEGYKWYVLHDLPCKPFYADTGCVTDFRVEVHTLGTVADAVVRFHSFAVEARIKDPATGQVGIVRHGGHGDTGRLAVLADGGNTVLCLPVGSLPNDAPCSEPNHREHSGANVPAPHTDHAAYTATWYGFVNRTTEVSSQQDEWGPIDYTDPFKQLFWPFNPNRQGTGNNSRGRVGHINVYLDRVPAATRNPNMVGGVMTLTNTQTNRAGVVVASCAPVAADCIPIVVEHARPIGYFMDRLSDPALAVLHEHDVVSPSTGKSLIRFPN